MFQAFRRVAAAALCALVPCIPPATAGPVAIGGDGAEGGRGFAFRHGNQCLVLTAGHVLADAGDEPRLSAAGFEGVVPSGRWVVEPSLDAARTILPVERMPSCSEPVGDPAWLTSARFQPAQTFVVPVRTAQGRTEQLRLRYAGSQGGTMRFTPERGQRAIVQGDSGSLIFLDDRPVAILLRRDTRSAAVEALRIDVLWTLWRDALQLEAPRVAVVLAGVTEAGRASERLLGYVYEVFQSHPGLAMSKGNDPRACRISVNVTHFQTRVIANPQFQQWRSRQCGNSRSFLDIMCNMSKGAEPPREISTHEIAYGLVAQSATGNIRVHNPDYAVSTPPAQERPEQILIAFVRSSLPRALDEGLRAGLCS